jgi:hypothetical protein
MYLFVKKNYILHADTCDLLAQQDLVSNYLGRKRHNPVTVSNIVNFLYLL